DLPVPHRSRRPADPARRRRGLGVDDGEGRGHGRVPPVPRLHQPVPRAPAHPRRTPLGASAPSDPSAAVTTGSPRLTVALTFDHDAISADVLRGAGPVL